MKKEKSSSKAIIRGIQAMYFFFYASVGSWAVFLFVFLEEERHMTGIQIGILAALMQVTNIVFLPLWGMISDRYGKRKIFLILSGISVLLLYGFIIQGGFLYYLLFIFVFVILHNPIGSILDTFAINALKNNTSKTSFGQMRLWGSVGWAAASFLTGIFIKDKSIEIVFYIGSFLLFCTWVSAFIYSSKQEIISGQTPSFNTIKTLLSNKTLLWFFILMLIYYILNSPTLMFLNLYLTEIGANNFEVGMAFMFQSLFELPFMFYGTKILKRFGIRRVLLFTMLIASVRMFLYSTTSTPLLAILIGSTHGITLGLFIIAVIEYTHILVPHEQSATGQSLMYSFLGLGTSIGNFLNGIYKDTIGLQKLMLINGLLVLIYVIIAYVFLFYKKSKSKIVPTLPFPSS